MLPTSKQNYITAFRNDTKSMVIRHSHALKNIYLPKPLPFLTLAARIVILCLRPGPSAWPFPAILSQQPISKTLSRPFPLPPSDLPRSA